METQPTEDPSSEPLRLDRWLWAARCYKTRSQAGRGCSGGEVRVNGDVAKASRSVRLGDVVEVRAGGRRRKLRVVGLSDKRGKAADAALLFEDLTPPPDPFEEVVRRGQKPGGRKGPRPTKRDRRRMRRG